MIELKIKTIFKNKIIIKKIFAVCFLLFVSFINTNNALAACSWSNQTCDSGKVPAADSSQCPDSGIPAVCGDNLIDCVCCCSAADNLQPNNALTIPDLQISIPGLDKFTKDDISCNNGVCQSTFLPKYIAGIYRYAVGIVGILATIVMMIGGIMWIVAGGNTSRIGEAKAWIGASITGLILTLCSYMILAQVNPALVNFNEVSLAQTSSITPPPENTQQFAQSCKSTNSGDCAVSNMSSFGDKANEASAICMAESGGSANISNKTTSCGNGSYAVWGLFQFNLSANTFYDGSKTLDCPKAFSKTWTNSSPTCAIIDQNLYNSCVAAASNPQLSIYNAQLLSSKSKTRWGPWEANSKFCRF
jgi:hypothetical protein